MFKIKTTVLCFVFIIFLFPLTSKAATLSAESTITSVNVGENVTVNIFVESSDQAINAASGVLVFPKDLLQVVSVSKTGSVFGMWVSEPSYSNEAGSVNFEGIILNPGFKGSSGKIMSVIFQAKKAGNITFNLTSGQVLANNGQGTNVFRSFSYVPFSVGNYPNTTPFENDVVTKIAGLPDSPQINSSTHDSSTAWYKSKNVRMYWNVPSGISKVRMQYDNKSNSTPTVAYEPNVSEKIFDVNQDGTYYFHLQYMNSKGWGPVSHYKFNIDSVSPEEFTIAVLEGDKTDNPQPVLAFNTKDLTSGIDRYEASINSGDYFNLAQYKVEDGKYRLPVQSPGDKKILIRAVDKAGNDRIESITINVLPLDKPIIEKYSDEVTIEEPIKIYGKSYPNGSVIAYISEKNTGNFEERVKVDSSGNYTFSLINHPVAGVYSIKLKNVDSRGAESEYTDPINVEVKESDFIKFSSKFINYTSGILLIVVVLGFIIYLVIHLYHKVNRFRIHVKKGIKKSEDSVTKSLKVIKKDIESCLELLNDTKDLRELSKEEKVLLKKLSKNVEQTEKIIKDNIEDIGSCS